MVDAPLGRDVARTLSAIAVNNGPLTPGRPPAYHFLPELAAVPLAQISIETAQSGLDLSVLAQLPGKTIVLGVIALEAHGESRRII